jgi:hypothetical protein
MQTFTRLLFLFAGALVLVDAQTTKPEPDEIVFTNGDKLAGHFVSSNGSKVTFKSDALGDITVEWSKVKEWHTSAKVAVIRKGVKLRQHENAADIPQGTLVMENQKLELTPPPQSIPVADSAVVIDQAAFQKAISHTPGFFQDWKGAITAGATVVNATQDNETFTGSISLVRAEPTENWLDPRNRTSFDFSDSYGELSQPATPTIRTSIFHAGAQRDEYFTTSLFAFGQASFDHNSSQGLKLEETYDGGVGWTVLKSANQTFDLKGAMSYTQQQFQTGANQNLVGSVFAEHYARKLPHGLTLDEHASVTPAWNNTRAYSAAFGTMLTIPVYKRLGGSTGVTDTFLNDPPPGFKKNSLQFMLGLTYTLQ